MIAEAHNNLGIALQSDRAARRGDRRLPPGDRARARLCRGPQQPGQSPSGRRAGSTRRSPPSAGHRARRPSLAEAHNNLGNVFKDQGRLDRGTRRVPQGGRGAARIPEAASNLLLTLHFHPDHDAQAILAEHRRWARQYAEPLAAEIRPHANDRTPDRTLRVGFVSPDFRGHPVGQLLLGRCSRITTAGKPRSSPTADVRAPDAVTAKLKALADEWHDDRGPERSASWPTGSAPTGSTSSSTWPCTPPATACSSSPASRRRSR